MPIILEFLPEKGTKRLYTTIKGITLAPMDGMILIARWEVVRYKGRRWTRWFNTTHYPYSWRVARRLLRAAQHNGYRVNLSIGW